MGGGAIRKSPKETSNRWTDIPNTLQIPRCGGWLPQDTKTLEKWTQNLIQHVEDNPKTWHPVIKEFYDLIESDPVIFMLFRQIFDQVPASYRGGLDSNGRPQVRNYQQMLALFNEILTQAPSFSEDGLLGCPINAILDWPLGTSSGEVLFLHRSVNRQLKKMLDVWAEFLSSPASTYVLNDSSQGWFGAGAMRAMGKTTAKDKEWSFADTFICDPSKPFYGFTSWDDFFTRRFRHDIRPVTSPDDDSVIVQSCESAPYRIYKDVKKYDTFWVKAQPYSLYHMLNHDPLASQFIGGTIYQSFLSATSYHRWHTPVSGTIIKTCMIPGSYYAEAPGEGFTDPKTSQPSSSGSSSDLSTSPTSKPDPDAPDKSQSYITTVATRALVFIQADNPSIGLMAIIPVGMAEVSTCDITAKAGQHLKKGEELGMFHYGGSTVVMLFRKEVTLKFDLHGEEERIGPDAGNIWVNEKIAQVLI